MSVAIDIYTPSDSWPTFAAWCAEQTCFIRWDRDNTAIDGWIVTPYTYCPNVAETLDDSNHQAIVETLAEVDPDGEQYVIRHHSHWATGYQMVLVRPGSKAFEAMDRLIARLADYPVLNEEDFSEREHEETLERLASIIRDIERDIESDDDSEDWDCEALASEVFSELHSGASELSSRLREQATEALTTLGYLE